MITQIVSWFVGWNRIETKMVTLPESANRIGELSCMMSNGSYVRNRLDVIFWIQ